MSFPRYPKYKDSGVEWLGEVPEHWGGSQSRRLFSLRDERARPTDRQLTASQEHGILLQEDFIRLEGRRVVEVIKGADILKHVEPNDFVISMRSFQGGIERSTMSGCISSAYVMLEPRERIHGPFFAYALKSAPYIQALQMTTNLVRDGQALRFGNFVQVDLPLVPLEEQRDIASFLDRETAKIDELVAEQQLLMELLKEKRQAVISHAVTKGLNPDTTMKPSGVEWLGAVPAHWNIFRMSGLARGGNDGFMDGDWVETPYITDSGVRLIQTGNVGVGRFKEQGYRYISEESFTELNCTEVEPGDLLICRLADPVGRACVAPNLGGKMITSVDVCILKPRPDMLARYLAYVLSSSEYLGFMAGQCRGGTRDRVSRTFLGSVRLAVPAPAEQDVIACFLDLETTKLDELLAKQESSLELLQERRAALIAAAVTGKIDVRHLAPEAAA